MLLRYHRRTGDTKALDHVVLTLDRMAAGGIRDHVGGGFHRYATDREWRVPHFEKMLYDNAQLAVVYVDAARTARRDDFAGVATEILDYLAREMTSPEGALWSATDADSAAPGDEEVEGYAFTWTPAEIVAAAGPDAPALIAFYNVTAAGQLEGRNVLHTTRPIADIAVHLGKSLDVVRVELARGRRALLAARALRPQPHRDDKVLAAWNGLAISAFARGAFALDRDDYADVARRAAELVLSKLRGADGRLRRSLRDGRASHTATLEDYAFVIQGLLDLFEATTEIRWLDEAIALQAQQDAHFLDPVGGYYRTADDAERLLVRDKPLDDGAEPSGNAVAIRNLIRLELATEQPSYRTRAEAALSAFAAELRTRGAGSPAALAALDTYHDTALQIVVVGATDRAQLAPLFAEVRRAYMPNRLLVGAIQGAQLDGLASKLPALEGKRVLNGTATAFVCEHGICLRPTSDPAELATQLQRTKPLLPDRSPAPLSR
ncbi:MAG: thioredoxin domain-containing protein [Deltaproteobacteria bacterium]|nr:thioredoxin domain-containing protein [Deltaproteobacteria bacterium]